jgi:high-affinity K+ transport system ATPase subunit B
MMQGAPGPDFRTGETKNLTSLSKIVTMPTSIPNPPNDGTRPILYAGLSMLAVGFLTVLLLQTLLGGFSPTGAHTNLGWMALIVALMCIPFGALLTALGAAKALRNRPRRH